MFTRLEILIRWRLQQADLEHALDIQQNRNQPARNPQGLKMIEHSNDYYCYADSKIAETIALDRTRLEDSASESRFKSFNYKFCVLLLSAK
jgi:hypothetical protein